MKFFLCTLAACLILSWLGGGGTVAAQGVTKTPTPVPGSDAAAQILVCRPGTNATEILIYRQPPGGVMEPDAAYTLKGIRVLREVEVYLGRQLDHPVFHIVALSDQTIRVFRNDAGRRRQYPSYILQAEAGKSGSWSFYHAKANAKDSFRSAVIEVDEEDQTTRVFEAGAEGQRAETAALHIAHAGLKSLMKRVRVKGLEVNILAGVVGSIELAK